MHFITGGAHNGKRKWVQENYQLAVNNHTWYDGTDITPQEIVLPANNPYVIISELEYFIRQLEDNRAFQSYLTTWLNWEKSGLKRQLILIGSDIGKGIVPMNSEDRTWRDIVGWCYQDIVSRAEDVTVVWYGIAHILKQREC